MHSRGRKGITCAIRATLLTASVGLDQEALSVKHTSPQRHVYDSQGEEHPSFAEDLCIASVHAGGKELLAL